jgi:hypothetical protein
MPRVEIWTVGCPTTAMLPILTIKSCDTHT